MKTVLLSVACAACTVTASAATLTYERFGAKGDGKTDDRAAVVAAHAEANRTGASVRAKDGATYFIGNGTESATIRTDVDFGTARFVIDDVGVKKINSPLFIVESDAAPVPLKDLRPLVRGQSDLGVTLPGPCLVFLSDGKIKRYIRKGLNQNNGADQQEVILADARGRVDPRTPLLWDYPEITKAEARPVDSRKLTVKGGTFVTIANQEKSEYRYHNRGFVVRRSNVVISGLRHEVTGELDHGAPYSGFIGVSFASDVTVKDCVMTAHKTYKTIGSAGKPVPMGSYDLSVNNAVNVSFVNCRQSTDINDNRYWGLFCSNYSKNLLFDGCEFSRFDAHMGVANATIRNSKLGYMGIHAIGFGTFLVEDTTVFDRSFFDLRSDYGSTWEGEFVVRRCRFVPADGEPVTGLLMSGQNDGQHDFGYVCHMPRKVVFDGLFIDDANAPKDYGGPFVFGDFNPARKDDAYTEKFPYVTTEEVVLGDVKTASGKPIRLCPNPRLFKATKIIKPTFY